MKYIKIWLLMALMVTVSAISFCLGRNYEAYYYNFDNLFETHQQLKTKYERCRRDASKMSDAIRCYDDTSSDSIFKDIQNEFLEGVDLKEYTYCY